MPAAGWAAGGDVVGEGGGVDGRADEVSLAEAAAEFEDALALVGAFDAFGDDGDAERFGELEDAGDEAGLDVVSVDAGEEGAVELEEVDVWCGRGSPVTSSRCRSRRGRGSRRAGAGRRGWRGSRGRGRRRSTR